MYNIFNKAYYGKKILVTGHTGFKGAWLCFWLNRLGAKIIGYSLKPPTEPNLFSILKLKKNIIHYTGDIRNFNRLLETIKLHRPEIVFHFAAQPIVKLSYDDPALTYDTNINGTLNLLEAMRKIKCVKTCIIATSDKCYRNDNKNLTFNETDDLGGFDPYSTSKACTELIVMSYMNSFFNENNISVSTVRCGNVIGGGDWGNYRLFPDCVKSIMQNKIIKIRNLNSVRPWVYILDALSGYLYLGSMMMKSPEKYNSQWNIGPENISCKYKTDYIVKKIIENFGKGKFKSVDSKFHESEILKLDTKKIKNILKWKALYDIDSSIRKVITWYQKYYDGCNMMEYTLSELDQYINS